MKSPVTFTVLIPTRDRADTLFHTLASVVNQNYGHFRILVSDNASEDGTADVVARFADPRITYLNTNERLSMSKNWEFALSHVTDGWVTLLGDDDALLPGSLETAAGIIEQTGALAVQSKSSNYLWPHMTDHPHGILSMELGRGWRRVDSHQALQAVLDGRQHYSTLPVLYNGGFVSAELIQRARAVDPVFFKSMTPDVYSAIVFALLTENYVYSDAPLAINGASHHSGGTAAFGKAKKNRSYDPAAKFWAEKNIPFHPDVPLVAEGRPVRSIQAIVYEAYLQAAHLHDLKKIQVTPARQLQLIIRDAAPHQVEVEAWAPRFAERHQIDLAAIAPQGGSGASGLQTRARVLLNRVRGVVGTFMIYGDTFVPMNNVHEASVVAGSLKAMRPTLPARFGRLASKVWTRLFARRTA